MVILCRTTIFSGFLSGRLRRAEKTERNFIYFASVSWLYWLCYLTRFCRTNLIQKMMYKGKNWIKGCDRMRMTEGQVSKRRVWMGNMSNRRRELKARLKSFIEIFKTHWKLSSLEVSKDFLFKKQNLFQPERIQRE